MSTENNQGNEQIKEDIDEGLKKKTSLTAKLLNSMGVKIVAVVGIICTLMIQNSANHFIETHFSKVHFTIEEIGMHFPTAHLLSDPEGTYINISMGGKLPFHISLENDNSVPIYVNHIFLVVDNFQKIPRDSFLLVNPRVFTAGSAPVTFLGTQTKINGSTDVYSFSILDSETGRRTDDEYLLIDAGYTDVYRPDIDFEDIGLYSFHFEVHYQIHGKTHIGKTNSIRILNFRESEEYKFENPENPELRDHLVESAPGYKIYGDGTIVLGKKKDDCNGCLYEFRKSLLKRAVIEEGVNEVNENYTGLLGQNITEIVLPSSLTTISDLAFDSEILSIVKDDEEGHVIHEYFPKTIVYDGTYDEWNEKVKIGKCNNALYHYDFKFKDGYKGYIYSHIPDELGLLARFYYIERHDNYVPGYDVICNDNNMYTIILYGYRNIDAEEKELVKLTSYTVNEEGIGTEDGTNASVKLK